MDPRFNADDLAWEASLRRRLAGDLDPEDRARTLIALANAIERSGRIEEARELFGEANRAAPGLPYTAVCHAHFLAAQREFSEPLRSACQRGLSLLPRTEGAARYRLHLLLAYQQASNDDDDAAQQELVEASAALSYEPGRFFLGPESWILRSLATRPRLSGALAEHVKAVRPLLARATDGQTVAEEFDEILRVSLSTGSRGGEL